MSGFCIDDIFAHAVEIQDSAEREQYLTSACAGNASLLEEVQRLSSIYPQIGDFIETPCSSTAIFGSNETSAKALGQMDFWIGRYRVEAIHAHGGMGRVYQARQDAPISRRVAIKVIRSELANEEILARFDRERELLNSMDHPNIARVLDAGMTERGEPYFVMEWVEGESLTAYADRHGLTIRERVDLLYAVCQAVHHAHQKGIIHRDLKPSNILVSQQNEKPFPKIIDFGIARATADSSHYREQITVTGQIMGTLDYMSPEQADQNNIDIDTRSDVYSLGALIYILLTHSPPLASKTPPTVGLSERLRIIKEVDPEKPSHCLARSKSQFQAQSEAGKPIIQPEAIDAELDWIVLKCLEKDRTRRYETVLALADDLNRYLKGLAVLACPPTLGYRMSKFAKRNRTILALVTSLGMLLLGISIVSMTQAVRVHRLHRQSQSNLGEAQRNLQLALDAVDAFCTRVSEDLRMNQQDLRPLRKELLSTAAVFHQQLLERRDQSDMAKLDLASAYRRLADLSREIDSPARARQYYELAIREFNGLDAERSSNASMRHDLARCWQRLAQLQMQNGTATQARWSAERSVAIFESISEMTTPSIQSRVALAETRQLQSAISFALNDLDQSDLHIRHAIQDWAMICGINSEVAEWKAQTAATHQRLGKNMLSRSLSEWRNAEKEQTLARDLARHALTLPDASEFCHQVLMESLIELGKIAKVTGRFDAALANLVEAEEMIEVSRKRAPSVWSHSLNLARCNNQLASLDLLQKSHQDAKQRFRRACELLRPLVEGATENSIAEQMLAEVLANLAEILVKEEDLAGGLDLLNEAVELNSRLLLRDPDLRVRSEQAPFALQDRGNVLARLSRHAEAIRDYDLAIEYAKPGMRTEIQCDRARALIDSGGYRQAVNDLMESLFDANVSNSTSVHASQSVRLAKLCVECGMRARTDLDLGLVRK